MDAEKTSINIDEEFENTKNDILNFEHKIIKVFNEVDHLLRKFSKELGVGLYCELNNAHLNLFIEENQRMVKRPFMIIRFHIDNESLFVEYLTSINDYNSYLCSDASYELCKVMKTAYVASLLTSVRLKKQFKARQMVSAAQTPQILSEN